MARSISTPDMPAICSRVETPIARGSPRAPARRRLPTRRVRSAGASVRVSVLMLVLQIVADAKIVATMFGWSRAPTAAQPAAQAAPRGCTNLKLRQLTRRVSQHYDRIVGAAGLKTTQYSLLSYVTRLGPARPGDIAAAMEMDASTLTRNLQPLVANGWVEVGPGARRPLALGHGHAGRPGQARRGAARMEAGAARAQRPARRGPRRRPARAARRMPGDDQRSRGAGRWLNPWRAGAPQRRRRVLAGAARRRRHLRGDDGRAAVDGPLPQRHQLDHRPRPGEHQPGVRRRPALVGADAAGGRHPRRPLRRRAGAADRPAPSSPSAPRSCRS